MSGPLVSVLINNYNYGRFLADAIDSALDQDYPSTEIIVVDDGSTDNSRHVIDTYAGRIISVLKTNGGQASAFNAGISVCQGEIVCFLDSDDLIDPSKVGRVVQLFRDHGLNSKPMLVHHLLRAKNETGEELREPPLGRTHPSPINLYAFAKRHRFIARETGPTTSISINRAMVERLFPLPEKEVRLSADEFVALGASLLGEIYSLAEPLGSYRVHGDNGWYANNQPRSLEFDRALENYLNAKLLENGLVSVISFDSSMQQWWGLEGQGRWGKLSWLMLKCCVRDRDRHTLEMAYHTTMRMGMTMMKMVRQKREAILKMMGARRSAPLG
jgi:glycosyltransferase involved in cell wall biosynthesis